MHGGAEGAAARHPADQLVAVRVDTSEREVGELAVDLKVERAAERAQRALDLEGRAAGEPPVHRHLAAAAGRGAEPAAAHCDAGGLLDEGRPGRAIHEAHEALVT